MQISSVDMQMRPGGLMGLGSWGGRGGKGTEPQELQLPTGKLSFPKMELSFLKKELGSAFLGTKPGMCWFGENQDWKYSQGSLSCLRFLGLIPIFPVPKFSPHSLFSQLWIFWCTENWIFFFLPFSQLLQTQEKNSLFPSINVPAWWFFGNYHSYLVDFWELSRLCLDTRSLPRNLPGIPKMPFPSN